MKKFERWQKLKSFLDFCIKVFQQIIFIGFFFAREIFKLRTKIIELVMWGSKKKEKRDQENPFSSLWLGNLARREKATKVFVNYFNFLIAWNFHSEGFLPKASFLRWKVILCAFCGTSLMGDNPKDFMRLSKIKEIVGTEIKVMIGKGAQQSEFLILFLFIEKL